MLRNIFVNVNQELSDHRISPTKYVTSSAASVGKYQMSAHIHNLACLLFDQIVPDLNQKFVLLLSGEARHLQHLAAEESVFIT